MKINALMLKAFKCFYYPSYEVQLLQRAELAPLPVAQLAWQEWRQFDRLDDIGWQEQKILARMHHRIQQLDPAYPHLARVIGMLKSNWTKTQLMLKGSLAALDLLLTNEIEVMLFKGLAWHKNHDGAGVRLSGDLDLLVREKDFIRALHLLEANQWETEADTSWQQNHHTPFDLHGLNYTHINGGNIDVHRMPLHGLPKADYMAGVWQRSMHGDFMGRAVRFCSRADYMALLISHATGGQAGEHLTSIWVGDLERSIELEEPDLAASFSEIIWQMNKPLECAFALAYCRDVIGAEKIACFSDELEPQSFSSIDLLRFLLNVPAAYQRWTLLWWFAGSLRRSRRYFYSLRDCFSQRQYKI